jgi:hypothetical protein
LQLAAFDGSMETSFYASHLTNRIVALEIDLGETVEVCAGMVSFGARRHSPQPLRLRQSLCARHVEQALTGLSAVSRCGWRINPDLYF